MFSDESVWAEDMEWGWTDGLIDVTEAGNRMKERQNKVCS